MVTRGIQTYPASFGDSSSVDGRTVWVKKWGQIYPDYTHARKVVVLFPTSIVLNTSPFPLEIGYADMVNQWRSRRRCPCNATTNDSLILLAPGTIGGQIFFVSVISSCPITTTTTRSITTSVDSTTVHICPFLIRKRPLISIMLAHLWEN